ncbi:helix-turn-helix domain-containing protein [Rhizobium cremeum]|uniref:helix-turn-helix domain-containing protein n=1 Tax=Rhizobium cremeum TaxID=2813827 RepID=UPI000DE433D3
MIQKRIVQKASQHLERSARSVQDIATQLGFSDQTYVSHFFKRETGILGSRSRDGAETGSGVRPALTPDTMLPLQVFRHGLPWMLTSGKVARA